MSVAASGSCAILVLMLSLGACQPPTTPTTFNPAFGLRHANESPGANPTTATFRGKTYYLHAERVISTGDFKTIKAGGTIDFTYKPRSSGRIGRMTEQDIGHFLCITRGDEILSAAMVQGVFAASMQTTVLDAVQVAEDSVQRIRR